MTIHEPKLVLERVAKGDPEAVRDCITQFGGLVWSLARRLSPSASDAEDAVQEIFLDLWRGAARYDRSVGSETTFVAMIARRRLIDRHRSRERRPVGAELSAEMQGESAVSSELSAEASLAAKALETLRPEQRQVLVLGACHGFSHEEIAEKTGMPLGTVKAHARRGLIRVREVLAAGGTQVVTMARSR